MDIGRHCPRFVEYQQIYDKSTPLKKALRNFYGSLVRICTHILVVLKKPGTVEQLHQKSPSLNSQ